MENSNFFYHSVRLADDAFVVRGGQNREQDIQRGIGTHPSGITGVSVESAEGVTIAELSQAIPHRQIGITTVGEVRKVGGDVVRTSGRSPYPCYVDWINTRRNK